VRVCLQPFPPTPSHPCATQAPEQFEGRTTSEKVDQYAFGVCLWEMATGEQPWAELDHPMQVGACIQ